MYRRATGSRPVLENIEHSGIAPAVVSMSISLFYLGLHVIGNPLETWVGRLEAGTTMASRNVEGSHIPALEMSRLVSTQVTDPYTFDKFGRSCDL